MSVCHVVEICRVSLRVVNHHLALIGQNTTCCTALASSSMLVKLCCEAWELLNICEEVNWFARQGKVLSEEVVLE